MIGDPRFHRWRDLGSGIPTGTTWVVRRDAFGNPVGFRAPRRAVGAHPRWLVENLTSCESVRTLILNTFALVRYVLCQDCV